MSNGANGVLWRRLKYMLTPQFDLYKNIAPHLSGKKVLEVGFGTGFGTLQLAMYAEAIQALEIETDAVLFARQTLPLFNVVWAEQSVLDVTGGPFYDAAVMIEVLEHIEDWQTALAKVAQVLVKGGKLYISARNANADLRRNDLHEREWTAGEFTDALAGHFSKVELFDYTLTQPQSRLTRMTPLIGVATK